MRTGGDKTGGVDMEGREHVLWRDEEKWRL